MLPNLELPRDNSQAWNFGQDQLGEKKYQHCKRIISMLEELKRYANAYQLRKDPKFSQDEVDELYKILMDNLGTESEYSKHDSTTGNILYREAAEIGYNICLSEISKRINNIIGEYHSYIYNSSVTTTGIILK